MPNSKSAAKRNRQNAVRRDRNREVRSRLRTFSRRFEEALTAKDATRAQEAFQAVTSELDRAARKGVIPRARASRRKSRMAARLQNLG